MSTTNDTAFDMTPLRKELLDLVAECARQDDLHRAKFRGKQLIRRRWDGNASKAASAFATSLERAIEFVDPDEPDYELNIDEMPPLLSESDAELNPNTDIDGNPVELVESVDDSGFGTAETSLYPVVDHPSGFRVCTCGAQRYYVVCKHTLARVIERNWSRELAVA